MKILHISDLHYGEISSTPTKVSSTHFFTDGIKPRPKDLSSILVGNKCFESPDIFVVSGDIGWSGVENDYKYFIEFLNNLKEVWRNTEIVIAPGNHDLDLNSLPDNLKQDAFKLMLQTTYGAEFNNIYKLVDLKDVDLDVRERLVGIHYREDKYLIISANTSARINTTTDMAYLRPSVLRAISEQIKSHRKEVNLFRVFVLHHHLLPFYDPDWNDTLDVRAVHEKPDTDVVVNSAKIQSWLSSERFNLVLHGHKHLFHGREDNLWREGGERDTRRLIILGAGSASVIRKELPNGASHSVNMISVQQLSGTTWKLDTNTFGINENSFIESPRSLAKKKLNSGVIQPSPMCVYNAQNISMCHAAIRTDLLFAGAVTNFISSVEDSEYIHPQSATIGDRHATEDEVRKSFFSLHPEYDTNTGWCSMEKIDKVLANLPRSFRVQHGPRLFSPATIVKSFSGLENLRPITCAIEALSGYKTGAYAGLYNLEKDTIGNIEPMPGLVGVQFHSRDSEAMLDIVFTFRNLELSFWWVVNMMEARNLLEWACITAQQGTYKPGRITFFSPCAEWKKDPRPMFLSTIDEMKDEELFVLLVSTSAGSSSHKEILANLIEEKIKHTSSLNIQYCGLERILSLSKGVVKIGSSSYSSPINTLSINSKFVEGIECATSFLKEAVNQSLNRGSNVERAKMELKKAVSFL